MTDAEDLEKFAEAWDDLDTDTGRTARKFDHPAHPGKELSLSIASRPIFACETCHWQIEKHGDHWRHLGQSRRSTALVGSGAYDRGRDGSRLIRGLRDRRSRFSHVTIRRADKTGGEATE